MNAVRWREDATEVRTDEAKTALSAFMDGEAEMPDWLHRSDTATQDWDTYHLIGDVLRTPGLARPVGRDFSSRFAQALADEPAIVAPRRRGATRMLSRYAIPGVALAAAVAAVTWIAQPYIAPSGALLQADTRTPSRAAVMSASLPLDPTLADYFDAHRNMAGMGAVTQASLDSPRP